MFCFDSESVSSIDLGKTPKKSSVTYEENLILQNPRYKSSVFYMEERTIQSVPVMPFALMLACISAVMGLIIGIFYAAIFGAIFSGLPSSATGTLGFNLGWLGLIFGIGAIITMPILFFILGLIQGVIYAWVYNFLSSTNRRNQATLQRRIPSTTTTITLPFFQHPTASLFATTGTHPGGRSFHDNTPTLNPNLDNNAFKLKQWYVKLWEERKSELLHK